MPFPEFEGALTSITNARLDDCVVSVCVGTRARAGHFPNLHRLQLSDDLAEAFKTRATDTLRQLQRAVGEGNKVLEPYNPGEPQVSYEVEIQAPPAGSAQLAVVGALAELAHIPIFDGADRTINKLIFYAVVIQRENQPDVYLFRKYSKTRELGRTKKLITLFSDGAFDKIDEPLFVFDDVYDAVYAGGHIGILQKDSFHSLFQYYMELMQHADQTLTDICTAVAIENAERFQADCRSNSMILNKLRSIAQRDYLEALTIAGLENKIRQHNLPIQIVVRDGVRHLRYDPIHKWKFLRLIDDGFLSSDLTGANYEVSGKRQIG